MLLRNLQDEGARDATAASLAPLSPFRNLLLGVERCVYGASVTMAPYGGKRRTDLCLEDRPAASSAAGVPGGARPCAVLRPDPGAGSTPSGSTCGGAGASACGHLPGPGGGPIAVPVGPAPCPSGPCPAREVIAIYGWIPGVDATVGVGNFETNVSQSVSDVLRKVKGGRDGSL